jgi:hypothetical protein
MPLNVGNHLKNMLTTVFQEFAPQPRRFLKDIPGVCSKKATQAEGQRGRKKCQDNFEMFFGNGKYLGFLILILLSITACGGKGENKKAQKKIEITITGLDGNGIAEKKITDELMGMNGVKTISFNYLNNQVVVLFDTTVVTQSSIITAIMKCDEGKHKVLDIKTNKEPLKNDPVIKPDPQEDIHDDVGDRDSSSG